MIRYALPTCIFPILLTAAFLTACSTSPPASGSSQADGALALPSSNVVDLTHPFNEETIYWPTAEGFERTVTSSGQTEEGYYYEAGAFSSAEHGGTHVDAPVHFWEGAHAVDEIPLDRLMGRAVVIDVTDHVEANPDYRITADDVQSWESEHGPVPDGAIVLFRTGFGEYWPDPERYLGTAEKGPEAVSDLHFPGLDPQAAQWLLENRNVRAVGIDTPSIDYGQSTRFETHQRLFERNVPAFENVANLDELPERGAVVVALPMKIQDGSGAPLRIVAFVP